MNDLVCDLVTALALGPDVDPAERRRVLDAAYRAGYAPEGAPCQACGRATPLCTFHEAGRGICPGCGATVRVVCGKVIDQKEVLP